MFIDWQGVQRRRRRAARPVALAVQGVLRHGQRAYEGEEVAYCPYIWVDRDFALARGWIQGFPKKLGSIWMTRTFGLDTPADPGVEPGAAYGATCAAYERRMARGDGDARAAERDRLRLTTTPRSSTPATSRASRRAATTTPRSTSSSARAPTTAAHRRSGRAARPWTSSMRRARSSPLSLRCGSARGWRLHDRLLRRRPRDPDGAVSASRRGRRRRGLDRPLDRRRAGRLRRELRGPEPDRRPRARGGLRRGRRRGRSAALEAAAAAFPAWAGARPAGTAADPACAWRS